jgi:hypothetical protein
LIGVHRGNIRNMAIWKTWRTWRVGGLVGWWDGEVRDCDERPKIKDQGIPVENRKWRNVNTVDTNLEMECMDMIRTDTAR